MKDIVVLLPLYCNANGPDVVAAKAVFSVLEGKVEQYFPGLITLVFIFRPEQFHVGRSAELGQRQDGKRVIYILVYFESIGFHVVEACDKRCHEAVVIGFFNVLRNDDELLGKEW